MQPLTCEHGSRLQDCANKGGKEGEFRGAKWYQPKTCTWVGTQPGTPPPPYVIVAKPCPVQSPHQAAMSCTAPCTRFTRLSSSAAAPSLLASAAAGSRDNTIPAAATPDSGPPTARLLAF